MSRFITLLAAAFSIASAIQHASADSGKLPDEAAQLKRAYQQAAERAVGPIRERYAADLKRLLEQATRSGKLDQALAIKNELDTVSAGRSAAAGTVAEFEQRLFGINWLWKGEGSKFSFAPDGRAPGADFTWKTVEPYTIEYRFPNGNYGTIIFERGLTRAAIKEIHPDGKKFNLVLSRAKD